MTEAMPFLQKAILLSYAPRPLWRGVLSFADFSVASVNQVIQIIFITKVKLLHFVCLRFLKYIHQYMQNKMQNVSQ